MCHQKKQEVDVCSQVISLSGGWWLWLVYQPGNVFINIVWLLWHTHIHTHAQHDHICLPASVHRAAAFLVCAVHVECFSFKQRFTQTCFLVLEANQDQNLFSPPTLDINRLLCSTGRRWDHCSDRDFWFLFNDGRQQEFHYSLGSM